MSDFQGFDDDRVQHNEMHDVEMRLSRLEQGVTDQERELREFKQNVMTHVDQALGAFRDEMSRALLVAQAEAARGVYRKRES